MAIQRVQVLIHPLAQITVEIGIKEENLLPRHTSVDKLPANLVTGTRSDYDEIVSTRLKRFGGRNTVPRRDLSVLVGVVIANANDLHVIGQNAENIGKATAPAKKYDSHRNILPACRDRSGYPAPWKATSSMERRRSATIA
jgi:hypothetical protein